MVILMANVKVMCIESNNDDIIYVYVMKEEAYERKAEQQKKKKEKINGNDVTKESEAKMKIAKEAKMK